MFNWPKAKLVAIAGLPGINHSHVRHMINGEDAGVSDDDAVAISESEFDDRGYLQLLHGMQAYMRRHLSTDAMAQYVMNSCMDKPGSLLFLGSPNSTGWQSTPDYQADTLFHGLRTLYGKKVVDVPKRTWMYAGLESLHDQLYGNGFSYAHMLDDLLVSRDNVEERLRNKEFSHVIYAVTHHAQRLSDLAYIDDVKKQYSARHVLFIDGSDSGGVETDPWFTEVCGRVGLCFRRELACQERKEIHR